MDWVYGGTGMLLLRTEPRLGGDFVVLLAEVGM